MLNMHVPNKDVLALHAMAARWRVCFTCATHLVLKPRCKHLLSRGLLTCVCYCVQSVAGSDTVAFYHTSAHTKFSPNPQWWQNNPNCDQHVRSML